MKSSLYHAKGQAARPTLYIIYIRRNHMMKCFRNHHLKLLMIGSVHQIKSGKWTSYHVIQFTYLQDSERIR